MSEEHFEIEVPADVEVEIDIGNDRPPRKQVLSFSLDFMQRMVLRDIKYWGRDSDYLYASMEIRGLFKTAKAGDKIKLTHDQKKKVVAQIEHPTDPYIPEVACQMKEYFDVWLHPVKKE